MKTTKWWWTRTLIQDDKDTPENNQIEDNNTENQQEEKTTKTKRKYVRQLKEEVVEPKTLPENKNKVSCEYCGKIVLKASWKNI